MSDERPSIADLHRLERAMVSAPWTKSQTENAALKGGPAGSAQVRCDAAADIVPSGCLIPYFILHAADAEGIAEFRNAARVLLEIAATTKAYISALDQHKANVFALAASLNQAEYQERCGATTASAAAVAEALEAMTTAAAKVAL